MIYAGQLRNMVQLQSYSASTGDRGQAVRTWSTYATVPAAVEPLAGRKLELARQLVETATHKVSIRFHPSLTVKDRIVFGSRILHIGNVNDAYSVGLSMELICTEQIGGD